MKSVKYSLIICLISFSDFSYSQISPTNDELTIRFNSRVKLLDEFINRFNFIESNKELSNFSKASNIAYLFNLEDKELISKIESKEFAFLVSNDSFKEKLSFYDDNLYVNINSTFKYNKDIIPIRFILKIRVSEAGYSWVISRIETTLMDSISKDIKIDTLLKYTSINPVDNEVNFIQFSELLTKRKLTKRNFANHLDLNSVSNYLALLNTEKFNFIEFGTVQYHFFQLPNFYFTLDFYKRPSNNSGWLISSVNKVSQEEKEELFKKLFR